MQLCPIFFLTKYLIDADIIIQIYDKLLNIGNNLIEFINLSYLVSDKISNCFEFLNFSNTFSQEDLTASFVSSYNIFTLISLENKLFKFNFSPYSFDESYTICIG